MRTTGEEVRALAGPLGLSSGMALERLRASWGTLFAGPASRHSAPGSLVSGKLTIVVDSPLWHDQLRFLRGDLLAKLAPLGVRDLGFRVGPLARRREDTPRVLRALTDDDRAFIEQTVAQIADVTLREHVRRALEKSLTHPRRILPHRSR